METIIACTSVFMIWELFAYLFAFEIFAHQAKSYYEEGEPRFYIGFPKSCNLTLFGSVIKWLIVYPFILIVNMLYWIFIWPLAPIFICDCFCPAASNQQGYGR